MVDLENLADFSQTYCYFQAAEELKGGQMPSRGYMSTIIYHILSIIISHQTKTITFVTFNNTNQHD